MRICKTNSSTKIAPSYTGLMIENSIDLFIIIIYLIILYSPESYFVKVYWYSDSLYSKYF